MPLLIGALALCVFLLGFGTAFLFVDLTGNQASLSEHPMEEPVAVATRPPGSQEQGAEELERPSSNPSSSTNNAHNEAVATASGSGGNQTSPNNGVETKSENKSMVETPSSPPSETTAPDVRKAQTLTAPASHPSSAASNDWLNPSNAATTEKSDALGAGLYKVPAPQSPFYTFAIADFASLKSARKLEKKLTDLTFNAEVVDVGKLAGQNWYSVIVGRFADPAKAGRFGQILSQTLGRPLSPMLLDISEGQKK